MEILHPTSPSSNHLNDASIVVRITFGDISFIELDQEGTSRQKEKVSALLER